MFIEETDEDNVYRLNISGDIRFQTLIPFREIILSIEKASAKDIILDLSGVDNFNSSAIGLLIRLNKHQKNIGRNTRILKPAGRVLELLMFTSLSDIIE